ncbi:MAG: TIGR04255 family protein [Nitrospinae bacterium]|nr:TIGR04255 family protein [Nitrospinota bacterium]
MSDIVLKNKPLVETIFEVKWALTSLSPGIEVDPHYQILLGRFFDRVSPDYPEHEKLAAATIPDEIVGQAVQHRFRIGSDDWPLLQIGPGIMSVNETHKYTWSDFRSRSLDAISKLFDSYPALEELKINNLLLRYIDAVKFDSISENILEFLKDKMKVELNLPSELFEGTGIYYNPHQFNWQSSFVCENPQGTVIARFATGHREGRPSLIWETIVQSSGKDVPAMPNKFEEWLESAHNITHNWFFKLIEGDLEREFRGD